MKTDTQRVERMYRMAAKLSQRVVEKGITSLDILNDEDIQWFVTAPLFDIGEQANHVSPDFANRYPEVPWAMIAGLRHHLVHDYGGTNWRLVASVVTEELPQLVADLKRLLDESGVST